MGLGHGRERMLIRSAPHGDRFTAERTCFIAGGGFSLDILMLIRHVIAIPDNPALAIHFNGPSVVTVLGETRFAVKWTYSLNPNRPVGVARTSEFLSLVILER